MSLLPGKETIRHQRPPGPGWERMTGNMGKWLSVEPEVLELEGACLYSLLLYAAVFKRFRNSMLGGDE